MAVAIIDLLPEDVLLDIHRRAPFLAESCKSGRALWKARAVTRLSTEGADEYPEHFARFVKELVGVEAPIETLVLADEDSAAVLWGALGYAWLEHVRTVECDARALDGLRAGQRQLETLDVIVRHTCMEEEVIELRGLNATTLRVMNEDWMPSEDPSMDWGVYYEAKWKQKHAPVLMGISPGVETLEVSGAITYVGGGAGLRRMVCDGCVLGGPLPTSLQELEMTSVRTLRSPNRLLGACRQLRRLCMDNMYVFASRIAEELWDAWAQTMECYVDEGFSSYVVHGTRKLVNVKEFRVSPCDSLFAPNYPRNYVYRLPHSPALQTLVARRITVFSDDKEFIDACPSVDLTECTITP